MVKSEIPKEKIIKLYLPLYMELLTNFFLKFLIGAGFKDFNVVEEQHNPDGNFSTVQSPNPEEPEALSLGIKLAKKN